jgi:hypothetical protein
VITLLPGTVKDNRPHRRHVAHAIEVLTLGGSQIADITSFHEPAAFARPT